MKSKLILFSAVVAAASLCPQGAEAGGILCGRTHYFRPMRPAIMVQPLHRYAPVRHYHYDYRPFSDRDATAYGEG